MQYTVIFFSAVKIEKFIEKKMIFFFAEAVLTCTHNLCFGAKIRKIGIPLQTPVLLYKSGVQWGYTLHGHVFLMKMAYFKYDIIL